MKEIPLRNRAGEVVAVTTVDEDVFSRFSVRRWSISHGYAVARIDGRIERLHRLVLGLTGSDRTIVGDHINGDTLDNRSANLRRLPRRGHQQNVCSHKGSTSRFRGVSFCRRTGRWVAQAQVDGAYSFLGRFAEEQDAARVAAEFRAAQMPLAVAR